MNADHYFEIGSTHMVCQDYALSGVFEGMAYGIVSDGCSTAEHSEVGAQILCHVAQYYVTLYHHTGLFQDCKTENMANLLSNSILKKADELRKLYPIDPAALQATLLIALATDRKALIFAWGDGIILVKNTTGMRIYDLVHPSGAPFYLSTDREQYLKKYPDEAELILREYWQGFLQIEDTLQFDKPFFKELPREGLTSITVCSDGIKTYQNDVRMPVNFTDMTASFVDYASNNGVFVQRCMNFLKRRMNKQGWIHGDDISCATVLP